MKQFSSTLVNYTIPSDNWEQQLITIINAFIQYYTIPSDNWEQQHKQADIPAFCIIPYQAITGNNNDVDVLDVRYPIIPYQAITGNNNKTENVLQLTQIIPYQAITGNNNYAHLWCSQPSLYHTKR